MVCVALGLILALFAPFVGGAPAQAQSGGWAPPSTVYLSETGQTLDRLFLDLWREGGGAGAFGYPITPEIEQADGHVVQYLQYARFEYWPEGDENGNTVRLGKIGEELRPISLRRTVSNFASPRAEGGADDAGAVLRAWLPVNEKDVPGDNPDIRYVEATRHTVWGGFRGWWEANGEASYLGNPMTEEYNLDGVAYQVFERGQLSWTQEEGILLVPVGKILASKYGVPQDAIEQGDIPTYSEELFVPPPTPEPKPRRAEVTSGGGEIWIDVNLSSQYMVVYQGDAVILDSYVSTGKPGFETPTGTFIINNKLPTRNMEGVLGGEYYNVENVPDVMYFTDRGHAIHGAYWHNNFGAVMSHGCINLPLDVSSYLYSIIPVGTRMVIHY